MTNDNKNTNELVIDDDDPTVELEAQAETFGCEPEARDADRNAIDEVHAKLGE